MGLKNVDLQHHYALTVVPNFFFSTRSPAYIDDPGVNAVCSPVPGEEVNYLCSSVPGEEVNAVCSSIIEVFTSMVPQFQERK